MTDIVERLRTQILTQKELNEAADEIERLRAESDTLTAAYKHKQKMAVDLFKRVEIARNRCMFFEDEMNKAEQRAETAEAVVAAARVAGVDKYGRTYGSRLVVDALAAHDKAMK